MKIFRFVHVIARFIKNIQFYPFINSQIWIFLVINAMVVMVVSKQYKIFYSDKICQLFNLLFYDVFVIYYWSHLKSN